MIRLLMLLTLVVVGCDEFKETPNADTRQAENTKKALDEADRQIGMPDVTRFTERKLAKDILELRDKGVATYTYIVDLHGNLHLLGESIGYGLPYSVQYTNPQRLINVEKEYGWHCFEDNGKVQSVPQADPNGLFMPEGLSATWVLLIDPKTKEPKPVYVEQEIIVSPFPLHTSKLMGENNG